MDTLLQDLRAALRGVRSAPALAMAVVATLAVAIGANTLIFSAVDAILLKALPFGNAARLVAFTTRGGSGVESVSARDFVDWQPDIHALDAMAIWGMDAVALTRSGVEPTQVNEAQVSATFFSVLGVPVEMGRSFVAGDDHYGATPVAILSDGIWRARFGADPHIIGRTVLVNGASATVVGIAPPSLRYPNSPALWVPLTFDPHALSESERGAHSYIVIGRLAPHVTLAQARHEVAAVTERLRTAHLSDDFDSRYDLTPLQDVIVGSARLPLLALLGAVGCVLLIACANVATLLLARATRRASDIGLRIALGASRSRIMRQLLAESLILAAVGGTIGVVLAAFGLRTLVAIQAGRLPRLDEVSLSPDVLGFSMLLVMASVVLFGLAPAFQASHPDVLDTLRNGPRGGSTQRRSGRVRRVLVIAETALAVVLLVGSGLLAQTFVRLTSVDLGFRPEHLVRFDVRLPSVVYTSWAKRRAFVHQVLDGLEALPGTQAAGAGVANPFSKSQGDTFMHVEGRAPEPLDRRETVFVQRVTPALFSTMGIPIDAGRAFSDDDRAGGHQVVIINAAAARAYFPGENPVGRVLTLEIDMDSTGHTPLPARGEIVGIVHDTKRASLSEPSDPTVFIPYDQGSTNFVTFVTRTTEAPATVAAAARHIVTDADPNVPIFNAEPFVDAVRSSVAGPALDAWLVSAFAAVALLLAVIGIYGLISHTVRERRREMGIRIALGARSAQVIRLVLGGGLRLAVLGVALGLAGAFVASRLIRTLLYGVGPTDTVTYAGVALGLLAVAAIASWAPARRAARVDPVIAMRAD